MINFYGDSGPDEMGGAMSSPGEVFSFIDNAKTRFYWILGCIFAFASAVKYPMMVVALHEGFQAFQEDEQNLMDQVDKATLIFVFTGVYLFFSETAMGYYNDLASNDMAYNFKMAWYRALLRQDMAYFDAENIAGTAATVSANGEKYKRGTGLRFVQFIQYFTMTFGCLMAAFIYCWQAAASAFVGFPLICLAGFSSHEMMKTQSADRAVSFKCAAATTHTTAINIRTVYALGLVKRQIAEFMVGTQLAYDSGVATLPLIGFAVGGVAAAVILCLIINTLYGGFLLYDEMRHDECDPTGMDHDNNCTVVATDIFAATVGVIYGGFSVGKVGSCLDAFDNARMVVYQAMKVMNREKGSEHEVNPDTPDAYKLPPYEIDSGSDEGINKPFTEGKISFSEVSFSYPTRRDKTILSNLSLDIAAGTTVAFVGSSGGGKSSTMNLIMRFYDPTGGDVFIDGVKVRDYNVKCLRSNIGYVQQEPKLFACTIRENIAYGSPTASPSDVEDAARKANAHTFIMGFPNGYETYVGDKGSQLSGGQKQRIAIARAIIAAPKILLLDEATSALDTESEKIVQAAIDKLVESSHGMMTTLIIAHRLSTIRNADAIAFIGDGIVQEYGSHDELMKVENGLYKKLVDSQNRLLEEGDESLELEEVEEEINFEDGSLPHVKFDRVTFAYPTRMEKNILERFRLSVRKNETMALVGPSGCGKSSCMALLERFYDPLSGKVEINGVDIKSLSVVDLRSKIGFVQQEPVLFDGTIAENVAMGCGNISMGQIEEAAKNANAHNFIVSFPLGYQTRVGEGGSQLSGGQKQRIAIARTILRNPEILLLDEATSALDSESEKIVQATLDDLMKKTKRTTLVIAHRLSTIRDADRIAVVYNGKVRELGNHNELIAKNGIYRRLVDLQSNNLDMDVSDLIADRTMTGTGSHSSRSLMSYDSDDEDGDQDLAENVHGLRSMAAKDKKWIGMGAFGAIFAGATYPIWGFYFGTMADMMFQPVDCPGDTREDDHECSRLFDNEADDMEFYSHQIAAWGVAIIFMILFGHVVMFTGFGTASASLSKRLRDASFVSLVRQEVGYFDKLNVNALTSQLQNDVQEVQAFTTQPIRLFIMNTFGILLGALIALFIFPVLAIGIHVTIPIFFIAASAEAGAMYGADEKIVVDVEGESPGAMILESLTSIRTVAGLTLEDMFLDKYSDGLKEEIRVRNKSALRVAMFTACGSGIQMNVYAWMLWWGGYLLDHHDSYDFKDWSRAVCTMVFTLTGFAIAMTDVTSTDDASAAAERLFAVINRKSKIDSLDGSASLGSLGNYGQKDEVNADGNDLATPLLA